MFYCALFCVHSGFAVVLVGSGWLVALLGLSSCCHLVVVWVFLALPWVCLQFVIVVFPDYTHLLCLFSVSEKESDIYCPQKVGDIGT